MILNPNGWFPHFSPSGKIASGELADRKLPCRICRGGWLVPQPSASPTDRVYTCDKCGYSMRWRNNSKSGPASPDYRYEMRRSR